MPYARIFWTWRLAENRPTLTHLVVQATNAKQIFFKKGNAMKNARGYFILILGALLACPVSAKASDPEMEKMLNDQEFCYTLASLANSTVNNRNSGETQEEQLDRRKSLLGENSPQYLLLQDITKQIYEKDLKNPIDVSAGIHASCLDIKGYTNKFTRKAIRTCPIVGEMVTEVAVARKKGATVEQVALLLGDRYGELPKTYGGGINKLAAKYSEESKPDVGLVDYLTCMIFGMKH